MRLRCVGTRLPRAWRSGRWRSFGQCVSRTTSANWLEEEEGGKRREERGERGEGREGRERNREERVWGVGEMEGGGYGDDGGANLCPRCGPMHNTSSLMAIVKGEGEEGGERRPSSSSSKPK